MINKSDEIYNQTQITNKQDIWMQQINIEAVDKKQIKYVSHYNPSQKEMTKHNPKELSMIRINV